MAYYPRWRFDQAPPVPVQVLWAESPKDSSVIIDCPNCDGNPVCWVCGGQQRIIQFKPNIYGRIL